MKSPKRLLAFKGWLRAGADRVYAGWMEARERTVTTLKLTFFFLCLFVFMFSAYTGLYTIAAISGCLAAITALFTAPTEPGGPIR